MLTSLDVWLSFFPAAKQIGDPFLLLVALGAVDAEGIGLEPDLVHAVENPLGGRLARVPLHGHAAIGEIDPRPGNAGRRENRGLPD